MRESDGGERSSAAPPLRATMAPQMLPCPEVQWSELSPRHDDPNAAAAPRYGSSVNDTREFSASSVGTTPESLCPRQAT